MSKIDELIAELCPDGVEFKELGALLDYEQPGKYIVDSTNYSNEHLTPVLTAGQSFFLGYTNEEHGIYEASPKRPVVIFDDFTTSYHWVDFNFKVKSSAMKMLRLKNDVPVDFRFVYFAMRCINYSPSDHARHWISQYSKFTIPVPPIEVQHAIIGALDSFTELEAELQAELEARKKQYEYYRQNLLAVDEGRQQVYLGDIATIGTGSHDTKDAISDGEYVFYARGREPLALDSFDFDEKAIITAGDGVGVGNVFHFAEGKYALHQRAYRIVPSDQIDARYLYHYLVSDFGRYLERISFHASVTSLRRPMFLKYPVSLPSLNEQRRVVALLDKFDKLTTDLSEGLPAEINARRKQYEYYRYKLLTFPESVNA